MPTAYLVTWVEFERGWGNRPDGYSLHPTKASWDTYYAAYRSALPKETPDEYSIPDGEPVAVEVDDILAEKLALEGAKRYWRDALVIDVGETGARTVREREPTPAKSFIELCLEKKASPDQVDDFVERWHNGTGGNGRELREYLGMTREEYADFMRDPASLYKTLYAHMQPAG